jgi:hypothetical protein
MIRTQQFRGLGEACCYVRRREVWMQARKDIFGNIGHRVAEY